MSDNILDATAQFMFLGGQPFGTGIHDVVADADHDALRAFRIRILREEFTEYVNGEDNDDAAEIADGLLDIIVVAWGTLLTYFGTAAAGELAAEVFRSNLSKVDGSLGPILRREDGKLLKPPGWTPPDIKGVLRARGWIE